MKKTDTISRMSAIGILLVGVCLSCTEYTPKPRGYMRIEPPVAAYQPLPLDDLPYTFRVSSLATVELPLRGDPAGWINIAYPSLGAKLYCSYLTVRPSTLGEAMEESRKLVVRQSQDAHAIREQSYGHPERLVFGYLYQMDGASVSPLQFTLTDSLSNFFRGSLLYDHRPNGDSIAPVTEYLKKDIMELMQSFSWKK